MSNFFTPEGAALTSSRQDWETPQWLFDELNKKHRFSLDPCASDNNAKCERYFTKKDNGLIQSWKGERVFCNPPYGRDIKAWVKKCYDERNDAEVIVLLIPARTDTSYFHDFIYRKAEVIFLRGRLKFEVGGVARDPAPFPSMLVIFRKENRMNTVNLTGRLTRDVELRYTTQTQTAVAAFTIAVQRNKDEADFPRCKAFGEYAENLSKFCRKGSLIGIVGRLETSSYNDKDGKTQYLTEVICDRIEYLEKKRKEEHPDDSDVQAPDDFKQLEADVPF